VSGRLITPASVEELTSALRELCSDAEKRQEFGAAGRKRVAAEFELHETVRRVGDLMRTVEAA
jgi:glycosyltransferase involved in cell wall biosynthesis